MVDAVDDTDGPYAVFDTHRGAILDDIADLVDVALAAADPSVAEHGRHLEQLVCTLRHGQDLVALRAAGSLVDVVLRDLVARPGERITTRQLIDTFDGGDSLARSEVEELRRRIVLCSAVQTLASFEPGVDPGPERLNRHAAVHTIAAAQYTPRNAMWAALVLANLIAEELDGSWPDL